MFQSFNLLYYYIDLVEISNLDRVQNILAVRYENIMALINKEKTCKTIINNKATRIRTLQHP